MREAARLRALLDAAIVEEGGAVVAQDADRIPTIASYHMPGVSARAQLIRFDAAGVAVSAGGLFVRHAEDQPCPEGARVG